MSANLTQPEDLRKGKGKSLVDSKKKSEQRLDNKHKQIRIYGMSSTSMTNRNRQKIEKAFAEAVELRDSGDFDEALVRFSEVLSNSSEYEGPILGMMGHIYLKQKKYNLARDCYERAVELKPQSEMASLGLFHTLWDMGREREAFNEAKRFLSQRESKEYFRLIEEMRDSFAKFDEQRKLGQ